MDKLITAKQLIWAAKYYYPNASNFQAHIDKTVWEHDGEERTTTHYSVSFTTEDGEGQTATSWRLGLG